ncbi:hypothetical protein [Flavobacterium pedocola]
MKLKLSLIALFFLSLLQAQSVSELKTSTQKIYEASYNMDFNGILDYTYPKLFDIVKRETMYETLDKTFQNEQFGVRFVYPNPKFTFSELKKIGNQTFCIINYKGAIRMKFEEKIDDATAQTMITSFKESMKDKKITFEKDRNSFLIEGNDVMIAVSDALTQNKWRFVNYDIAQKTFLDKVIPEAIRKQLGLQ